MAVKVELLEDVAEGGRSIAKAIEAAKLLGLKPGSQHYPVLKVTTRGGKKTEYRKGAVIEMNPDGAAKWVKAGIAKIVDDKTA